MQSALQIGWSVDQFWDATPRDLLLGMRAHNIRERNSRYMIAWNTALLLQPHLKKSARKTTTPEKLLGLPPRQQEAAEQHPGPFRSAHDLREWVRRRAQEQIAEMEKG